MTRLKLALLAVYALGIAAVVTLALSGHPAEALVGGGPLLFFFGTTHSSLTDQTDTSIELPPQSLSGAGGAQSGNGVDMQGWEGVVFNVLLGLITGSGALDAWAQSSPTSKTCTDMANITSGAITQIAAAANSNAVAQISIYRPTNRYVRCQVNQTVNTLVVGVTATRFRRSGVAPGTNVGQPSQSPVQVVKVVQN